MPSGEGLKTLYQRLVRLRRGRWRDRRFPIAQLVPLIPRRAGEESAVRSDCPGDCKALVRRLAATLSQGRGPLVSTRRFAPSAPRRPSLSFLTSDFRLRTAGF